MKFVSCAILALSLLTVIVTSCGYHSRQSEMSGQVKRLMRVTPLVCPDRTEVDISLGIMRNGVGSMSHEDARLVVINPTDGDLLAKAAETGELVKIVYDVARFRFCQEKMEITKVELIK